MTESSRPPSISASRLGDRARFAMRYVARHLLASLGVAGLAALLVFGLWYPAPTAQLQGAGRLFVVLLAVDAMCGPLLTLLLTTPSKRRRELRLDLTLIVFLQLIALGYGLYVMESARPVAYVFEQDRLVLVTKNEVYGASDCQSLLRSPPATAQDSYASALGTCIPAFGLWGLRWQRAQLEQDVLSSIDLSLQGISPAMRPATWVEWDWQYPRVQHALRPLTALRSEQQAQFRRLTGSRYWGNPELSYLPLVSSKTLGGLKSEVQHPRV